MRPIVSVFRTSGRQESTMKRSSVQRFSYLLFAPFLVTLLLLPAGCDQPQKKKDGGTKVFQIGMSQCNLREPWRGQMETDILRAAKEHDNVHVIFKDEQNDTLRDDSKITSTICYTPRVDALGGLR